jgi:hypothetical protein
VQGCRYRGLRGRGRGGGYGAASIPLPSGNIDRRGPRGILEYYIDIVEIGILYFGEAFGDEISFSVLPLSVGGLC